MLRRLFSITEEVILKLENLLINKDAVVVVSAANRWIVESYLGNIFFWYSKPFQSSSSAGFINNSVKLNKKFKELVVIDCDELEFVERWMVDLSLKIFYTSSLEKISDINSIASDIIILYQNGFYEIIKENYKMCDFC